MREPAIYVPLAMDPRRKVDAQHVRHRPARSWHHPPSVHARTRRHPPTATTSRRRNKKIPASVTNLRETWTDFAARPLYFFAGAVFLVLLIACVNNAGLLLARGLARRREFALRATLGAGAAALIRQSLAESLLLSLAGGVAGTLIGIWVSNAFAFIRSEDTLPRTTAITSTLACFSSSSAFRSPPRC